MISAVNSLLITNVTFPGYVFFIIVKGHFFSPSLSFLIAIFTVTFCTVCLVFMPANCMYVCVHACIHMHTCTLSHTHTHFTRSYWLILHHPVKSSPETAVDIPVQFVWWGKNHSCLDICSCLLRAYLSFVCHFLSSYSVWIIIFWGILSQLSVSNIILLYLMTTFQVCMLVCWIITGIV